MTTRSRPAAGLVILASLALGTSCAPAPAPPSDAGTAPAEAKADGGAQEAPTCPGCVTPGTGSSGAPADAEADVPPLATAWVPADRRRRIRNLDIPFHDQDGRPGVLADLVDRPALITFFYTRCQNSSKCSAAVSRLAALQRRLAQAGMEDQVRLLAVTYEPQFDTPEQISRYGLDRGLRFNGQARALQLDPARHQRLVDELQAPVNYNAGWVNTHGVELSLIDARGRLVRKYHTVLWDHEQVLGDVRQVLAETR